MRITRADAPRCIGGESPMWDARGQRLHYLDNFGCKLHTFDPDAGTTRTLDLPGVTTTLILREGGGAVVTLRTGIHFLDLESGEMELISPLTAPPPHVFNDGKADARGRCLLGASTAAFDAPTCEGGLLRLDPDRTLTWLDDGTHFSNGPCWSPDGSTFYFSDSWLSQTYAYDYDMETGAVFNRRVFVRTDHLGGLPDGATVDADGLVWIAIHRGGKVAAFRPDGRLERTIDLPVKLVTSVMFGGPDHDRLFVTTMSHGIRGEPVEDDAGCLYVIDGLGAKGLTEYTFSG